MVDGGSLENCCTAMYRGFESLRLRAMQSIRQVPHVSAAFVFVGAPVESLLS